MRLEHLEERVDVGRDVGGGEAERLRDLDRDLRRRQRRRRIRDQVVRRDADDSTVSSFQVAADGVVLIDSSALDFGQTVAAVLGVGSGRSDRNGDGSADRRTW